MTVGSLTGFKGHVELAKAFEQCDFGTRHACLLLTGNKPRMQDGAWLSRARVMRRAGGFRRVVKWGVRTALEKLGLESLLARLGYPRKVTSPEMEVKAALARINTMPNRRALLVDLPRAELIQAYLNSDLFAFASNIEYSPLVLFEAAAAGLPFVSVPVGNAAEIAQWTGGGMVCKAQLDVNGYTRVDPQELAERIEQLAQQPDVLARLGASGRQAWEARFSWDKIFRSYETMIQECIEKAPA
jgi:glycosyltransferase involved in cell wall biosynthesis